MKSIIVTLLVLTAFAVGQVGPPTVAPAVNASANGAAGPAGTITTSTLNATVSAGPVFCNGGQGRIARTTFSVPASSTNWVIFNCPQNQLYLSSTPAAPFAGQIQIAKLVSTASAITVTDSRVANQFPKVTDGYFVVPPSACAGKTSGTVGATNNTLVPDGASNTPVLQVSATNAAASNNTFTCLITVPSKLTTTQGAVINDITVSYGVQTTALTSVGTPTVGTITLPAAGTSETPSTVTPVTAGSVTVTPVVGSANLGTTTAGSYYTEKVALATPLAVATDLTLVVFSQVFAQSASAAQIVNVAGLLVHYTVPLF